MDENVEALNFETETDLVGVTFMTALAPRGYEIAQEFRKRGKKVIADREYARDLFGLMAAVLGLRLGLTYRYDNCREQIFGYNPAKTLSHDSEENCKEIPAHSGMCAKA